VQCYKYKIGYLRGKVLESEGKYEGAQNLYVESLSLNPRHYDLRKAIGKIHRLLGNADKSIKIFKNLLLPTPMSGELNLELAKSYFVDGNRKKALEYLKKSMDIWVNADAEYKPAIESNEKWVEWNQVK